MKKFLPVFILVAAVSLSGCAWFKHQTTASAAKPASATAPAQAQIIVTPDESLAAKVVSVNTVGRFVVLNFPEGQMPKLQEQLFLYRGGLKSAVVKAVGPQEETRIVADIVSGDAQVGDTVRDQ
jgi:hypothetical protein